MSQTFQRNEKPDLVSLRESLKAQHGKTYWRSFNELAESEAFTELIQNEFPRQAQLLGPLGRRDFLKIVGASLAFAGLTACVPQAPTKILPYSDAPEALVPGKPVYFASALPRDGYGTGILVRSEMGRPIKIDGNPRHPVSRGTGDLFMQASILDLYDPDRAKNVTENGADRTWDDFFKAAASLGVKNLRILTGTVTSTSLVNQINSVVQKFPQAKWHQYSPISLTRNRNTQVFDQSVEVQYHFENARVILSLDADFLFREPGSLLHSQNFGAARQPGEGMSRLYVVESGLSLTGSNADHRLPMRSSDVEGFTRALAARLGIANAGEPQAAFPGKDWIDPLAADLQAAGANSLVIAGERQPAAVHALAQAINQALGAAGTTVTTIDPIEASPVDQMASLQDLAQALDSDQVDLLLILEGNPVYTAPADLDFVNLIKKAKLSAYLGPYADETAAAVTWHLPAAHFLETWGDVRAVDGTTSIIQPLIEPLYGGKSGLEVLAGLLGQPTANGYDLVRSFWQSQYTGGNFESYWKQALNDGFFPASAPPAQTSVPTVSSALWDTPTPQLPADALEIVFEPDPTIWDGQYSNNAWLQELPKPLTKLTWDNAVLVSPAAAQRLGLNEEDVIQITVEGRSVEAPVYIQPGQAEQTLTLTLGYGRERGGKVQEGLGYNTYSIRTTAAPWFSTNITIQKTAKTYHLVTTRDHQSMENRDLVREATLAEFLKNPAFAQDDYGEQPSLYDPVAYPGHAWGMSINLGACIGCNACVLACQSENNIPTVGKEQVDMSREMHWLRIDRYFKDSVDEPSVVFEPVPCMHCEQAPCEPVCPVGATTHSAEGVNEMTYNRCVGTRYCSNNCPYKVRRFNFLKYEDSTTPSFKAMRNPDVSVRMRGVMEKCTYCIQRINSARIQSEVSGVPLKDGDVRTACQQVCPTQAITFGDINDADSQVRKLKDSPLNYALLGELGTRPRTTYLAKVKNPNPQLKTQA